MHVEMEFIGFICVGAQKPNRTFLLSFLKCYSFFSSFFKIILNVIVLEKLQ